MLLQLRCYFHKVRIHARGGVGPADSSPTHGDDDKNLYALLYLEHEHEVAATCGGKISGSNFRFCTKPKHPNLNCCLATKHRIQAHSLSHDTFYIMKNSTSAFVSPVCTMSKMSIEQIHHFKSAKKNIDGWRNTFSLINNSEAMSDDGIISETNRKLNALSKRYPLKTPSKVKAEQGRDNDEDDTFYEAEDDSKFTIPQDNPGEWDSLPNSFRGFFAKFVTAVAELNSHLFGLGRDVRGLEKMSHMVGQDLETLDINLRATQDQLGDSMAIAGMEAPAFSAALDMVSERIVAYEGRLDVIDMTLADNLRDSGQKFEKFNIAQKQNWKRIAPLLLQVKDVIRTNFKYPIGALADRISKLEIKLNSMNMNHNIQPRELVKTAKKSNRLAYEMDDEFQSLLEPEDPSMMNDDASYSPSKQSRQAKPPPASTDIFERLKYLEDTVSTLQARSTSEGVRVQHHTFQSKDELKEWIQIHLVGCRFGIFSRWRISMGVFFSVSPKHD